VNCAPTPGEGRAWPVGLVESAWEGSRLPPRPAGKMPAATMGDAFGGGALVVGRPSRVPGGRVAFLSEAQRRKQTQRRRVPFPRRRSGLVRHLRSASLTGGAQVNCAPTPGEGRAWPVGVVESAQEGPRLTQTRRRRVPIPRRRSGLVRHLRSASLTGGAQVNCAPTCARERTQSEGWKSPRGLHHGPETERNCVAVRRGGEQREVNDQSAG